MHVYILGFSYQEPEETRCHNSDDYEKNELVNDIYIYVWRITNFKVVLYRWYLLIYHKLLLRFLWIAVPGDSQTVLKVLNRWKWKGVRPLKTVKGDITNIVMAPPRETSESSLPFKVYSFTEVSRDQMCSPQQIHEQEWLQKTSAGNIATNLLHWKCATAKFCKVCTHPIIISF